MKNMRKGRKRKTASALVLCAAMTAVPVYSFAGGSVSVASEGVYQVHCTGLTAGNDYSVTVVRGTLADYTMNADSVLYAAQLHADAGSGEVTVRTGKEENAVVLLSGEIQNAESPEVIGLIEEGTLSPHHYSVKVQEAACTEPGSRTYTCSHCSDVVIRDVTPARGHQYEISQKVSAGEDSEGFIEYRCRNCGDVYRETLPADTAWECPFQDVEKSSWYYDSVKYAYRNSLFNGITETSFQPDSSMTRAMLVTVLYRMEGTPSVDSSANVFTDVVSGSWYEKGVVWASSKGVVNGTGDGLFAPDANVTREQMTAILYRYASLKGCSTEDRTDLKTFTDGSRVSSWAEDPMSWACAAGLISGITSDQGLLLSPSGNATRAQVAAVLKRYLQNVL